MLYATQAWNLRGSRFITASHVEPGTSISSAILYILKNKAYESYQNKQQENEHGSLLSFDEWEEMMAKKSPNFFYWTSVLHLKHICLRLVRSFREANFALYIDALKSIPP